MLVARSLRRSAAVFHVRNVPSSSESYRAAAPVSSARFFSSERHNTKLPRVVSEQTLFENPWIRLKRILFLDAHGSERHWTGLERTTTYPKTSSEGVTGSTESAEAQEQDTQEICDAVVVFPFLTKQGAPTRVVLIRQFRPPVGQWVLELPAGLIDAKEVPEVAAMRELKEETGYVGSRVLHMGPPMVNDQGVTNGKCRLLLVEIRDEEQQSPLKQQLEPDEIIHVVHAPLEGLVDWLEARKLREKDAIDARLYSYALGLHALPRGLGNSAN
ncbi:hypothetical protein F441_21644 [Phytophthora nicotianae CJ01A1]|uniref:Nudix hydrolase domain-containing protein n=4 Tax=Phytophthora nicotianae TaxID=4792 RepID=W2QTA2_PHYN3|nr:hypothetical protein PPTG_06468 [Phytophthora nicotianae INRA-310]ETI31280.1 hypothetical protein F443_21757 [Phytophthora nicotianae P1569]ETK71627.1 hypothetical protein L915_21156 [Phytophthora nicotianae]ETP01046.1 hypothetical protein F441_21644 [Phytophthora nicotianae CJ01A1]KUF75680.1 ADP-sugar pyrophosphatase [Phytophthora nicotianae]ETL25062.1 hypothetical protein L916_21031 [Phytophthora nicotianae]